jgi:hypothetical protein
VDGGGVEDGGASMRLTKTNSSQQKTTRASEQPSVTYIWVGCMTERWFPTQMWRGGGGIEAGE